MFRLVSNLKLTRSWIDINKKDSTSTNLRTFWKFRKWFTFRYFFFIAEFFIATYSLFVIFYYMQYINRIFTSCTTLDGDERPWCATSLSEEGEMATWGYCDNSCPGLAPTQAYTHPDNAPGHCGEKLTVGVQCQWGLKLCAWTMGEHSRT